MKNYGIVGSYEEFMQWVGSTPMQKGDRFNGEALITSSGTTYRWIAREDQARGIELTDYINLGCEDQRLLEIVRSRIRQ